MKPNAVIAAFLVLSMLLAAGAVQAEDKADAAKSPLLAKLVLKKATYTLDPAQQGEAFRKMLKETAARGRSPQPPAVDIVLVLTNTSKEDVTIMEGADNTRLTLELKGPGAMSLKAASIFTREFRLGKAVVIAAGKSHEIPIKSLKYGFRGVEMHAYWTEPGDYTLSAKYTSAPARDGDATGVSAEAVAVKVKVEAKE